MRVIAVLLFTLTVAAEPFAVSPPVELGPAPGTRTDICVATNGDTILAVWRDHRASTTVRGALLDRDGLSIADRDFLVSPLIAYSTFVVRKLAERPHLALASDGSDYLAAHSQYVRWGKTRTHFTRITGVGAVEAGRDAIDGTVRSMVFAGGYYFVATVPNEPAWRATLAIVDGQGRVLRENLPMVHAGDDTARDATLLGTEDGELLIAWEPWHQNAIGVARVKPDDVLHASYAGARRSARLEGMRLSPAAITEGPDGFLVASIDRDVDREVLMLALLEPDGALRRRENVRNAAEHTTIRKLAAGRERDGYVIFAASVKIDGLFWVSSLRVTAEGDRPLGGFRPFDAYYPDSMAVLRKGGALFWARIASDRAVLTRTAILYDGSLIAEGGVLLSRSVPTQSSSTATQCGGTNIVAWRDQWNGFSIMRLRRFSATGQPLDPPNRNLGELTFSGWWDAGVSIVCGRTNALITWKEPFSNFVPAELHGALLRSDGTLLDLGVVASGEGVRASYDGSTFVLLAYGDRSIWQRWTEQGLRIDTAMVPELDGKTLNDVELAWDGTRLMVAWIEREYDASLRRLDVHVRARAFRRNFLVDGPELEIAPEDPPVWPEHLALGARPGQWLASWLEFRGWSDHRVHSSALNGTPSIASLDHVAPLQLSWNGEVWELLDRYGVALLDEHGGAVGYHRLLDKGDVQAMTSSGGQRLFTFIRNDPVSGTSQVFAGLIDEQQLGTTRRRRAMR